MTSSDQLNSIAGLWQWEICNSFVRTPIFFPFIQSMILIPLLFELALLAVFVAVGIRLYRCAQTVDVAVVKTALQNKLQSISDDAQRAMGHTVDKYRTLEDVQMALRTCGVTESVDLMLAIDMTRSNLREHTGKPSLHRLPPGRRSPDSPLNEYEHAIVTLSRVVVPLDTDRQVPMAVFGCSKTRNRSVEQIGEPIDCRNNIEAALLDRYRQALEAREFDGPTSFAAVVRWAVDSIAAQDHPKFTVLVIVCDGDISRECCHETYEAIIRASHTVPLGIIIVGVGDGNEQYGWAHMQALDERMPERSFDNVRFVAHDELVHQGGDTLFAVRALQEIPAQYKAAARLRLFGKKTAPMRARSLRQ